MSTTIQSNRDRTVLGCCMGCCAVLLVLVALVGGVTYYTFRFGRFAAAPPADTLARLGGGPALVVRLDAEAPGAFSPALLEDPGVNAYNGALLRLFRPYEATLTIDAGVDGAAVGFGTAVSMPRGAEALKDMISSEARGYETEGRELTSIEIDPEQKGLLVGRGVLPLPVEARALRGEAWQAPLEGDAPALERGHFIEMALDNREGGGALALTALAQVFGEANEDPQAEPLPLSLLSQVRIIKGSRMVRTAWAALDFTTTGDVTIKYRVSAANETCAVLLSGILADLPFQLMEAIEMLESAHLQVSPSQTREGAEITGEITVVGVGLELAETIKAANADPNDDPFNFLQFPQQP